MFWLPDETLASFIVSGLLSGGRRRPIRRPSYSPSLYIPPPFTHFPSLPFAIRHLFSLSRSQSPPSVNSLSSLVSRRFSLPARLDLAFGGALSSSRLCSSSKGFFVLLHLGFKAACFFNRWDVKGISSGCESFPYPSGLLMF